MPIIPENRKSFSEWRAVYPNAFVAIGGADIRGRITLSLEAAGFARVTLIHPSAAVSPSAELGPGTLVCPRAVINADARIGKGCIINTGAIVEHECKVRDFSHVSPGAVLCGGVTLGEHCRVCMGAAVFPCVEVGRYSVVAGGAAVLAPVPEYVLAAGVPAEIRKRYPVRGD